LSQRKGHHGEKAQEGESEKTEEIEEGQTCRLGTQEKGNEENGEKDKGKEEEGSKQGGSSFRVN
jgi:hypothetical protein